jgi:hypothetical protein
MFKFLKKLFSEPEEAEQVRGEEIKISELNSWFKSKSDHIFNDLNVKVKSVKIRIKEEITKAKDNLAILGVAKLHNPKISVKEIQFMEGNRRAYILAVNNFLRGVELEKEDYSAILHFCSSFEDKLERFGKSTVRTYHILQEFFANEGRNIAINIKNLDALIKELKMAIGKAKIHKVSEIQDSIVELNNSIKQKNEFEVLLEDQEKVKSGFIKNKAEFENELESLLKGKGYKQLNELKVDKETILASIREHNAKIVHAFSVMERPLRKLTRVVMEDNEVLKKYIENPVEALVNDNELKIVNLLKKLEHNINNYTLDLKDKKREKVLETVKGLTEEFLREFINKHNELEDKFTKLENDINENEALKMENKLSYELSNAKDNLEKVSIELLNKEQELSKINIKGIQGSLENEINLLLGTDVVIG